MRGSYALPELFADLFRCAPSQSLCHFLQTQLTEYYHLISILETQMASSSGDAKDDSDGVGIDGFEPGEGLTLMRLGVWTREARLKMRLMSLMVDDCRCAYSPLTTFAPSFS